MVRPGAQASDQRITSQVRYTDSKSRLRGSVALGAIVQVPDDTPIVAAVGDIELNINVGPVLDAVDEYTHYAERGELAVT